MIPKPFEIYQMRWPFNGCEDPRPWLVIEYPYGPDGVVSCFPIASECYQGGCCYIDKVHPDFPATGLAKSCHIIDSKYYEVPYDRVIYHRGELQNELLAAFREHSGL